MDWRAGRLALLRTTGGGVWRLGSKGRKACAMNARGKWRSSYCWPPEVTLGGAHGFKGKGKGYTFERWPQNI